MNWTFHFNPASRDLWMDPIYTNNINIFVYLYGESSSGARIGVFGGHRDTTIFIYLKRPLAFKFTIFPTVYVDSESAKEIAKSTSEIVYPKQTTLYINDVYECFGHVDKAFVIAAIDILRDETIYQRLLDTPPKRKLFRPIMPIQLFEPTMRKLLSLGESQT